MAKVAPILKCSVIINNILMGGVLWLEFRNSTGFEVMMYVVGILLCLVGMGLILTKTKEEEADE